MYNPRLNQITPLISVLAIFPFDKHTKACTIYGIANKSTTGNVWLPGKIIAMNTIIGIKRIPEINVAGSP